MADDDKTITGEGGTEAAEPKPQPDNVVTDNAGVVPVQPVATSDPTITDNTNPKVFFDGAAPENIPPHDSNEQLHLAAGKRIGAELSSLTDAPARRREAVDAAYDVTRDVREVVGDQEVPGVEERHEQGRAAIERSQASRGNRAQPPTGRAPKSGGQQKA